MTDRELKKLTRTELLEMLLVQTEEVERLQQEVLSLQARLNERDLNLAQAGNIAEAALRMNSVFETAQAAADQYLENIAQLEKKTMDNCLLLKKRTKQECLKMVRQAELEASAFWESIREKVDDPYQKHQWWQELMELLDDHIVKEPQGENK